MEKNLQMIYLLDFYGEMLHEKQRRIMELYYGDDLSLSEIALAHSMSRQGVRDNIKRAEGQLLQLEEKLGLIARYQRLQPQIEQLLSSAKTLAGMDLSKEARCEIEQIISIAEEMRETAS